MGLLHAILLAGTLAVVVGLIIMVIGKLGEAAVERHPEMRRAASRLPLGAQMENRLEGREADVRAELTALQNALGEARRRRYALDKELEDARRSAQAPVRVVGREDAGLNRFVAWMVNRLVQQAQTDARTVIALDPEWAGPQVIEVWSENLSDARRDLLRYFPAPLGYVLLSIQLANSGKAAKDTVTETESMA
ncbi:hypothetical protein [Nitrospirillum sp. BR 11828]|uniref:hypothetical protein n=1 Tax=Nitrospirillum sp. BR 11828 TaxID=3104325 RepID=UPI002ACAD4D4|nr:hypothetical protein [Nitrospirillum sp. BR 11828]MDZ5647325.1 hypothetical protein [Nitrospirillum sp. BR 11828]